MKNYAETIFKCELRIVNFEVSFLTDIITAGDQGEAQYGQ